MSTLTRFAENPLITTENVVPSRADFKVEGVFNCAAVEYQEDILLLCRVAESAPQTQDGVLGIPLLQERDSGSKLEIITLDKKDSRFDFSDSRSVAHVGTGRTAYLTTLSHLRLARSRDGRDFTVDSQPFLSPWGPYESWGIEDPRITRIGETFYIAYSSASSLGVSASLASTRDFQSVTRHGVILPPSNKDVMLFPEVVDGRYLMLHRPCPTGESPLNIWIAESDNLVDWGRHQLLYSGGSPWEEERVGAGVPPIRTERGWLCLYHGANRRGIYSAGALLLDLENPRHLVARTKTPLLIPDMPYESGGFYGGVVFPCGAIARNDGILLYYGGADDKVCGADIPWDVIWNALD